MAYYECNNQLNNVIVYDVNYSLTATATVHHLDLANHKELIIVGGLNGRLTNINITKYAFVYDLTDDSIFDKLIGTELYISGGSTYVNVKLDISKTFLTAQIYNSAHNNLFTILKIILI